MLHEDKTKISNYVKRSAMQKNIGLKKNMNTLNRSSFLIDFKSSMKSAESLTFGSPKSIMYLSCGIVISSVVGSGPTINGQNENKLS